LSVGIKRNKTFSSCLIPTRALLITSLIMTLLVCLPGCNNNSMQNSSIPSTTPATQSTSWLSSSIKPTTRPTGSSPSPSKTTTPFTPVIPDMSNRISEMLKVIPDIPEVFHGRVYFIDFAAWRQSLGINLEKYRTPDGSLIPEGENNYIKDLVLSPSDIEDIPWRIIWHPWLGWPPFVSGMGSDMNSNMYQNLILKSPIRKENTGYSPLDIERSIVSWAVFENLPGFYEAINGNFDLTVISQVMDMYDPNHHPQLSTNNGVDVYSWDTEMNSERSQDPPVFDEIGRGRTLAVQPGDIFSSIQAKRVDQMVDASLGKVASLADNPRYQEMADKMETMSTMSAVMSIKVLKPDFWVIDNIGLDVNKIEFFDLAASYAPVMGPYTAFASGLGMDELGLFVNLVLTYDSPEMAKRDVGILEKRLAVGYNSEATTWQEEIDSSEVWSDGPTLCAKLRGKVTNYWDSFLWTEPLLVREN
jgi:hypothetical protein